MRVNKMKMPEHWRTSRVYVIVVFAILTLFDVMTSFCDATWHHDVMLWRHTMSWCHIIGQDIKWKCLTLENDVFQPSDLDLWPMTLAIKLVWEVINTNPCTNFQVHTSIVWLWEHWLTDRHTDTQMGPILLPYYLDCWRSKCKTETNSQARTK